MIITGKERMYYVLSEEEEEKKSSIKIKAMLKRRQRVFSGREESVDISGGSRELGVWFKTSADPPCTTAHSEGVWVWCFMRQ